MLGSEGENVSFRGRFSSRRKPLTPPAGAILISAATGGTLSLGTATLTFAPGALSADAWVSITARAGTAAGILARSSVFDLRSCRELVD